MKKKLLVFISIPALLLLGYALYARLSTRGLRVYLAETDKGHFFATTWQLSLLAGLVLALPLFIFLLRKVFALIHPQKKSRENQASTETTSSLIEPLKGTEQAPGKAALSGHTRPSLRKPRAGQIKKMQPIQPAVPNGTDLIEPVAPAANETELLEPAAPAEATELLEPIQGDPDATVLLEPLQGAEIAAEDTVLLTTVQGSVEPDDSTVLLEETAEPVEATALLEPAEVLPSQTDGTEVLSPAFAPSEAAAADTSDDSLAELTEFAPGTVLLPLENDMVQADASPETEVTEPTAPAAEETLPLITVSNEVQTSVKPEPIPPVQPAAAVKPRFCTHCGTRVEGMKFCPRCGKKVQE